MLDSNTAQTRIGNYRWVICALLFFATTINYMDRQVIGILRPVLEKELHWANPEHIDIEYGYITTAFTLSYAIGVLIFGWFVDKVGTKIGYGVSVAIWGLSSLCHALARSSLGLGAARVGLGIGESGNFPSAIKAVAEWFPKKDGALAAGIFNSRGQYRRGLGAAGDPVGNSIVSEVWNTPSGKSALSSPARVIWCGWDSGWRFIQLPPRRKTCQRPNSITSTAISRSSKHRRKKCRG